MKTQIVPKSHFPADGQELSPAIDQLYYRGDLTCLAQPSVAVVGSRKAGAMGCAHAQEIASGLSHRGVCVVSGLAVGIDAAAHRGALESACGRTIAVMAHGLDTVYPRQHALLAEEVLRGGGLLVSEYPDETPPRPHQFLGRNRLIAWLSIGVVVIEAGYRSGALSTAHAAMMLGREVMVLPGPVSGGRYSGGHRLIRDGAHLIEHAEDVLLLCGQSRLLPAPAPTRVERALRSADPRATQIAAVLDFQPNDPHDLCARSGLTMADLMAGLLLLELEGHVTRLTDGRWSLRP
jgi:DNA processing protein